MELEMMEYWNDGTFEYWNMRGNEELQFFNFVPNDCIGIIL